MSWKDIAKKNEFIYSANAFLKSKKLKNDLKKLGRCYSKKARQKGYRYIAESAVEEFKSRHKKYIPNYKPAQYGELRIFWAGTSKSQDESGLLQALERLGDVTVFYNATGSYGIWGGDRSDKTLTFEKVRRSNGEALLEQVRNAHKEKGIDVLFGQMWASLISSEALSEVQSMGIPVINIAMDDRLPVHWGWRKGVRLGSIGLKSSIDMALTTSSETCAWYGVEGCPAIFWPLASDPHLFAPEDGANRDIDVLFIGNRYGIRGELVEYLNKNGVNVECYGRGWRNGFVNAEQMADLSKRARIILGVGTVGHCRDVYTLKLRDFDALMTGALYITHRNRDLFSLYEEGEEIEFYETPIELYEKVSYYLNNSAVRERIGRKGQLKAQQRDSWDQRLTTTFKMLGLLN